jgi:hypothetical protein
MIMRLYRKSPSREALIVAGEVAVYNIEELRGRRYGKDFRQLQADPAEERIDAELGR